MVGHVDSETTGIAAQRPPHLGDRLEEVGVVVPVGEGPPSGCETPGQLGADEILGVVHALPDRLPAAPDAVPLSDYPAPALPGDAPLSCGRRP